MYIKPPWSLAMRRSLVNLTSLVGHESILPYQELKNNLPRVVRALALPHPAFCPNPQGCSGTIA
eukprot:12904910-Prorocentrum_lima.AAC.1